MVAVGVGVAVGVAVVVAVAVGVGVAVGVAVGVGVVVAVAVAVGVGVVVGVAVAVAVGVVVGAVVAVGVGVGVNGPQHIETLTADENEIIGKTIASVNRFAGYGEFVRLTFTDGSTAAFRGTGYDGLWDDVAVIFTPAASSQGRTCCFSGCENDIWRVAVAGHELAMLFKCDAGPVCADHAAECERIGGFIDSTDAMQKVAAADCLKIRAEALAEGHAAAVREIDDAARSIGLFAVHHSAGGHGEYGCELTNWNHEYTIAGGSGLTEALFSSTRDQLGGAG